MSAKTDYIKYLRVEQGATERTVTTLNRYERWREEERRKSAECVAMDYKVGGKRTSIDTDQIFINMAALKLMYPGYESYALEIQNLAAVDHDALLIVGGSLSTHANDQGEVAPTHARSSQSSP